MSPCERPLNPAARLALACTGLGGIVLLLAGLLLPDPPMPVRTVRGQTPAPIVLPTMTPSIALGFVPVGTPKATFYVSARAYALLSKCGLYLPELPAARMPESGTLAMQPVPECWLW